MDQVHAQIKLEEEEDNEDDEEEEELAEFPYLDGTALFSLICTMNHSCEPNVTVCYDTSGIATAVALRDILVLYKYANVFYFDIIYFS